MQLFVNDLTVLDFSYLCPQRGMIGESWLVDVLLTGELDAQSMVFDFAHVKRVIKQQIDLICDHRLLVPQRAPEFNWCTPPTPAPASSALASKQQKQQEQQIHFSFATRKGEILLKAPAQSCCFIEATEIDPQIVSRYLIAAIQPRLPANVTGFELTLRPQVHEDAYYHYSHGLKKHDGNCQRIAHGHRSPIQIYNHGQRSFEFESLWAQRWADIYLGTAEDLTTFAALSITETEQCSAQSHYAFAYQAPQGWFELIIPKSHCEILATDTTVELLALYIQQKLQQIEPTGEFKIVAYEGVQKGAIATSPVATD